MTKLTCEGCGADLLVTADQFEREKAQVAEVFGEAAVSAVCPPCGELIQTLYALSAAMGAPLDGETMLHALKLFNERQKHNGSPRKMLIEQIWAVHKQHGVDYTANPVAVDFDPFSEDKLVFERAVYNGQPVIECEGVIVERL